MRENRFCGLARESICCSRTQERSHFGNSIHHHATQFTVLHYCFKPSSVQLTNELFQVPKFTKMEIIYDKVLPDDYVSVIEHLRHGFFADEPLNKSLLLCEPGQPHQELEDYSLNVLQQEMSMLARLGPGGEVVGACLAGSPQKDLHIDYEDAKLKKIFGFIDYAAQKADLNKLGSLGEMLDFKILSVDGKMRGRGLGGELYRRTEQLARNNGFKLLRADATALFSQKILEKFGWETLIEIKYDEYLGPDNTPVFTVSEPHTSYKMMYKRL